MKKGTKAMSKRAEEAQASAILPESIISYAKDHAVLSGLVYREGVKYGYEQAEKDLALTWIDIRNILSIAREVKDEDDSCLLLKSELCDEILRRFNAQRKK